MQVLKITQSLMKNTMSKKFKTEQGEVVVSDLPVVKAEKTDVKKALTNIDQIEFARNYILLPAKTKNAKPIRISSRMKVRLVVEDMLPDSVILTTGRVGETCVVVLDYTFDEIMEYVEKAEKKYIDKKKLN